MSQAAMLNVGTQRGRGAQADRQVSAMRVAAAIRWLVDPKAPGGKPSTVGHTELRVRGALRPIQVYAERCEPSAGAGEVRTIYFDCVSDFSRRRILRAVYKAATQDGGINGK